MKARLSNGLRGLLVIAGLFSAIHVAEMNECRASGGISRNGEVLTIGSSGLQVSLNPLTSTELPELTTSLQGIKRLVLPTEILGRILRELRP